MRKYAILGGLFIIAETCAPVRATTLPITGEYGDVTNPSAGVYDLTSVKGPPSGYAGVYANVTSDVTPDELTVLSAGYQMTTGTFGGGAPRFSIGDDSNNEAYVFWGDPQAGGTFTDPAAGASSNTGNYADPASSDIRVQVNGFGGDSTGAAYETWGQFLATDGNIPIGFITVDLDGGFTGTQEMTLSNVDFEYATVGPAVTGVPLPATFWTGSILLVGTMGMYYRRRRQTQQA